VRFSELDGRRIGVWGAGAETRSFASQLARRLPGARIAVVVLEEPAQAPELTDGATVVDGAGALEALRDCDVLVRSPGVSIHRPELRALASAGLPTATPTGLWLAERGGRRVLGVTGTKGKSTTATLIAHLLAASGAAVELAGNIGRPALELLDRPAADWVVVELSSYQIADLAVGPETAVVLNLYREHLDWHLSEQAYRAEKLRILALSNLLHAVVPGDSPAILDAARAAGVALDLFATPEGWHVREAGVARGGELVLATESLPLPGAHNARNLCAALTALEAVGVAVPALPDALAGFTGLPHRLQAVHEAGGVLWVDDSISTTPESAAAAIASFPDRSVILIGGGLDRGQDHTALGALLAQRTATVIGLPTTGTRLVEAARSAGLPADRLSLAADLPAAVAAAHAAARPGAVVLLSPAAPSFNAYVNFIARGEHFAQLARASAATS
jgi:UDP-N-acetylmuramoyl-L-alanine---L-glutamate ligase